MPHTTTLQVRHLGLADYEPTWQAMQAFTQGRTPDSIDEIWLLEHPPIFTLGLNGKKEHVLDPGNIRVVPIDRGGQITYHGPGQLVAYIMVDIARKKMGVHDLVRLLEQAVLNLLAQQGIASRARRDAPGVYVGEAKIAALGLRIKKGCSYHGLALNVDMDLEPFARINPCGYPGMEVTDLKTLLAEAGISPSIAQVSRDLLTHLSGLLGYTNVLEQPYAVAPPALHE